MSASMPGRERALALFVKRRPGRPRVAVDGFASVRRSAGPSRPPAPSSAVGSSRRADPRRGSSGATRPVAAKGDVARRLASMLFYVHARARAIGRRGCPSRT